MIPGVGAAMKSTPVERHFFPITGVGILLCSLGSLTTLVAAGYGWWIRRQGVRASYGRAIALVVALAIFATVTFLALGGYAYHQFYSKPLDLPH